MISDRASELIAMGISLTHAHAHTPHTKSTQHLHPNPYRCTRMPHTHTLTDPHAHTAHTGMHTCNTYKGIGTYTSYRCTDDTHKHRGTCTHALLCSNSCPITSYLLSGLRPSQGTQVAWVSKLISLWHPSLLRGSAEKESGGRPLSRIRWVWGGAGGKLSHGKARDRAITGASGRVMFTFNQ
jgi:hypothetical protein